MARVDGPVSSVGPACEAVLRSLPDWFGIEESLLEYVADTERLPTFVTTESERVVGFATLRRHFEQSWELHCIAIAADHRGRGLGRALLGACEPWLIERGARFLLVKIIAATSMDPNYAQTRVFYERLGFVPLEVFPTLWSPRNPCLQMVKCLA
jgi:GNAT superfamily N-acetyltransferase